MGQERHWRYCQKCSSIFKNARPGFKGACTVGGEHSAHGFDFTLDYDLGPAVDIFLGGNYEKGWRECGKCHGLYQGAASRGICPAGDGHQEPMGLNYQLWTFNAGGADKQSGWKRCSKCESLFFDDPNSRCKAGGGHQAATGRDYTLNYPLQPHLTVAYLNQGFTVTGKEYTPEGPVQYRASWDDRYHFPKEHHREIVDVVTDIDGAFSAWIDPDRPWQMAFVEAFDQWTGHSASGKANSF
ncbi:hypothetical protein [Streptomyces sp. WAC01280]|uniref:hypothetical protein n=1 Tax=Streptomyces sp. WAC01280 TaxID=2487424 RepID=UPI000F78A0B3|nr:hypothetical protein [Streptomyces sp. WAC01280]RSS57474.1 hypothetical protein EF909_16155 [Streptomyces sp. WAC01280]